MEYWTPHSETHPREHNSKRSTYHQWCALPTKRALVTHSPYILHKYMFLNLPRGVIRSTARFRLSVHTLRFETATWNQSNSPTCDMCEINDIQDEQHVLFHCANPHTISLRRKYAPLFPPTHDVFNSLSQSNNKLYFYEVFLPFLRTFQQPNPFCCSRSTTNLFMISFLSRTIDYFFFFLRLINLFVTG